MQPTPDIAHVQRGVYAEAVYDPAEDTFALMDALEEDAKEIANATLCVEIGSGSGCVSAFVAQMVGTSAECTVETAARNKVSLEPVLTSTLDALLPRTSGQVDLLLFNPPYVVTSDEEESAAQAHAALGGAWAGGTYGTALLQRILDQGLIEQSLAPGGRLYLVAIKQNDPDGLVAQLQKRGLEAEVVLKRRANRELLHILRAIKP